MKILVVVLMLSFELYGGNLYPKDKTQESSITSITGSIKTKPSLKQDTSSYKWDNTASLGYKLSKDMSVSYNQDFSLAPNETTDMAFILKNGILRFSNTNIWTTKLTSLNDDFEIYFPLEESKRDAGLILIFRNDFQFLRKITDFFLIAICDAPVLHLYSENGFFNEKENKYISNPIFENQFVVSFEYNLSPSTTLKLPLLYFTTLNRDYDYRAELNGSWVYYLGISPNIEFTISNNFTIGVGYDSNNFISDTEYGPTLGDGFNSGSFWLSLKLSI